MSDTDGSFPPPPDGSRPDGPVPPPPPPPPGSPYGAPPYPASPYDAPPPASPYDAGYQNAPYPGAAYPNVPYPNAPYPGGGGPAPTSTDGVSIGALVTSFLCVFAPVGVILGIVGIRRTRNGQRKGRGFAIAGIVIGLLMSAVSYVVAAGIWTFVNSFVSLSEAKAGQCVDVSDDDSSAVILLESSCTEPHDGQVVATVEVDDQNRADIAEQLDEFCGTLVPDDVVATLQDVDPPLDFGAVIDDPEKVEIGDHLVCYVTSDKKLERSLLGSGA